MLTAVGFAGLAAIPALLGLLIHALRPAHRPGALQEVASLTRYTRIRILGLVTTARPMSVIIPAALIPIGAVATVIGPEASRAFTLLPDSAKFIAHSMGMLMLLGGVLVLLGIAQSETFTELIGLALAGLGCAIYGAGVIIGLGLNGMVTGPMFLAIAASAVIRVMHTMRIAHTARVDEREL